MPESIRNRTTAVAALWRSGNVFTRRRDVAARARSGSELKRCGSEYRPLWRISSACEPARDDAAGIHGDNPVGFLNGREAVRDDQRRAPAQRASERAPHGGLGLRVEVARGLVEQQDRRVLDRGTIAFHVGMGGDGADHLSILAPVPFTARRNGPGARRGCRVRIRDGFRSISCVPFSAIRTRRMRRGSIASSCQTTFETH